jgi:hypothetical protein
MAQWFFLYLEIVDLKIIYLLSFSGAYNSYYSKLPGSLGGGATPLAEGAARFALGAAGEVPSSSCESSSRIGLITPSISVEEPED